jgi:uncharacterized protein
MDATTPASILAKCEEAETKKFSVDQFIFGETDLIGNAFEVETGRITIKIASSEKVKDVSVGRLAMIESNQKDKYLLARIEKVSQQDHNNTTDYYTRVGLVGSFVIDRKTNKFNFSRSLIAVPTIGSRCYFLEGIKLTIFMTSVSINNGDASLTLGKYSLDESVAAYIDGDKLFQRHMALVGSTGCGKSWTVAALIEQIAKKPSANAIILDIHGEYQALHYAMQYRIATPGDLLEPDDDTVFMPCWFMTHDELMTIFLDRADADSSTQSLLINEAIRKRKLDYLRKHKMEELIKSFTVDSPIPYDFNDVLNDLKYLNTELIPGVGQGEVVKGPFNGKFDRLLPKLEARIADKRYGFMFSGPKELVQDYNYINKFAHKMMGTGFLPDNRNSGIKVLNFSMTPSEMLPVVIGVIGRFLFSIQFWNNGNDRHPVVLICDECHLYLPPLENCNDAQRNTVFHFGRIAKEGRKYGLVLGVVTQRPSDCNPSILSQAGNIMTLRLTNAIDQEVVKKLMPDGMTGLIEELPLLGIGELITIGDAVILPLKTKVTPATCPPTSVTPTYCSTWAKDRERDGIDAGIDNMRKQFRKGSFAD